MKLISVKNQVDDQVWNQVWGQVISQVNSKVYDEVYDEVYDQVSNEVRTKVRNQVRNQVNEHLNETIMTAHITRTSILTNRKRTLQLPQYTPEQLEKKLLAYNNGHLLLEEAFPELSNNAREFIKNGTIEKEWDEYLSGNEITDEH